jgi:hypothetical protein
VDGWPPPPPVLVPIYQIADWLGPKWLVIYDGTADHRGLRLVHLGYGEPLTNVELAGIITFAKQPAEDLGNGNGILATDLPSVADYALLQLLSRLPHPASTRDARRAWERQQFDELSTGVVESPAWRPMLVEVNGTQLQGRAATVDAGTAICVDAGEVFIGIYFVRPLPTDVALRPLADLSGYPMPSDDR